MKKKRIFAVVNGQSGNGKSYFIKNYIIPKLAEKKPVIVLDIVGEYPGQKHKGFIEFFKHVIENEGHISGVHSIQWVNVKDAELLIKYFRQLEKPVSIVFEEAHLLFNSNKLSKDAKNALEELAFMGRHFSIDVILCTQRPKSLTTDIRSQAQFFVSFLQKERADLEYLRQKSEEAAGKIPGLNKFEFIAFGPEIPTSYKELKKNKINKLNI